MNPNAETKEWIMPDWMEPYRNLINNTGGNTIENLMNDTTTTSFTNSIRSGIIVAVYAQVQLLVSLKENNLLKGEVK